MFNYDSLIGLEKDKAIEILNKNGYNNIKCQTVTKHNNLCDSLIVVKTSFSDSKVTLLLGEFYCKI